MNKPVIDLAKESLEQLEATVENMRTMVGSLRLLTNESHEHVKISTTLSLDKVTVFIDYNFTAILSDAMAQLLVNDLCTKPYLMTVLAKGDLHYYNPGSVTLEAAPYSWCDCIDLLEYEVFRDAWDDAKETIRICEEE